MSDTVFDLFWGDFKRETSGYPKTDCGEDENGNAIIRVAVTDMGEDDVSVSVDGDTLKISGDKVCQDEKIKWQWKNIATRKFNLSYRIVNRDLDLDSISANHKNGMLEIKIPKKSKEELDKRKIKINFIR